MLVVALLILGFLGATFSGLLGIGGAIIMIPLLLYVPPALGLLALDMQVVAGLSIIQVLAASFSGVVGHRRNDFVRKDLVICMGAGSLMGSLAGSIGSKYVSTDVLSIVFAGFALAGVILMFLPQPKTEQIALSGEVRFNRGLAFIIALAIGVMGGMVGAGGAFILIPCMILLLRIPIRISIGSSLGIAFLGAVAATAGKMATGQVVYPLAIALVLGAVPGAQLGSRLSKRMHTRTLRLLLTGVMGLTAVRMWADILWD